MKYWGSFLSKGTAVDTEVAVEVEVMVGERGRMPSGRVVMGTGTSRSRWAAGRWYWKAGERPGSIIFATQVLSGCWVDGQYMKPI